MAALVPGERGFDSIVKRSGLDPPAAGRALARLVDAGLVERGADGSLGLRADAFAAAAAGHAARRSRASDRPEHPDPEVAKVLRTFFSGGTVTQIPTVRRKRLVVLDRLAQAFEPGRRYRETEVNAVLARVHADVAALRRYLVDEGFLDRAEGQYWRSGGAVETEAATQERARG